MTSSETPTSNSQPELPDELFWRRIFIMKALARHLGWPGRWALIKKERAEKAQPTKKLR